MERRINELDDRTAIEILDAIAQSQIRRGGYETEWTPEIAEALKTEFLPTETPHPPTPSTPGELARQALLLLSRSPEHQAPLSAMIDGPKTRSFSFSVDPVSIVVITGAVMALQTHVKIQRDKEGRWTFLLDKESAPLDLIRTLLEKIFGVTPKSGQ